MPMMRSIILLSITAAAALSTSPGGTSKPVQVWNGVLPSKAHREALQAYASKSGLEHKCFSRPLVNAGERNIIERTLDAILTETERGTGGEEEPNQYVEYWTRQEWRHIEAHADVDENRSKQMDKDASSIDHKDLQSRYPTTYQGRYGHRYPTYGHVLYLQVGSEVRGPTCLFPGRSSGGDLLQSMGERGSEDECVDGEGVNLVTVPAVQGRLLRFDGRDLHAVPRPSDLWMLPFVKGGAEYEPEELWGRSVILFNVWPGDEEPPLDVPLDRTEEGMPEGLAERSNFCSPFRNWDEIKVIQKEGPSAEPGSNQSVKVWLLGNERRRDHPMRTASLLAPAEGGREIVKEALAEESKVTELWLRQS